MQDVTLRLLLLSIAGTLCLNASEAAAPRLDRWKVIGPGGGGSQYAPTVSPHNPNDILLHCDMTGSYISHDGARTWRMFNLRGRTRFYLFDPVDPNTIYVQTVGLWRSTNRGKSWNLIHPNPATVTGIQMPDDHAGEQIISSGEPRGRVTALAVDPADSKILYASIPDAGAQALYLSTDWAKTWKRIADLPGGGSQIYIDPKSPRSDRNLYVIGRNSVALRRSGKWTQGQAPSGVDAFVDTSAGFRKGGGDPVIYVAAAAGTFVSVDGGRSWRRCSLPSMPFTPRVTSIAASLFHGDVAYLSYDDGRGNDRQGLGVAKTTDGGRTWEIVWDKPRSTPAYVREAWMWDRNGAGWGRNFDAMGVSPTDPNLCYGSDAMRTMRSTDGGKTWEAVYAVKSPDGGYTSTGVDVTTCYGVHFDPFDRNRMVISYTDIGQFRSENGGKSWTISTNGIPREWRNTTYWMVFDPDVKGRVWGVMSYVHDLPRPKMWNRRSTSTYVGGICRSDDGAKSWNCFPDAIPAAAPTHILMDPASSPNARVLYVAAFGRGVYKSANDGKTWTLKNNGIAGAEPFAWRFERDSEGALYLVVARRSEDGSFGNDGDGAIYRSEDGADHWSKVDLPKGVNGPNGLAVDPRDPKRLYLAAWGRRTANGAVDGGIFLSTDRGASWRPVFTKDQHVYDITIDSRNPDVLYACGFESSAWRSTDRGQTWRRIRGYNFKWGHRVIPDPYDPSMIYITTFGGSVWHGPAEGDPNAPEDIETPAVRFSR